MDDISNIGRPRDNTAKKSLRPKTQHMFDYQTRLLARINMVARTFQPMRHALGNLWLGGQDRHLSANLYFPMLLTIHAQLMAALWIPTIPSLPIVGYNLHGSASSAVALSSSRLSSASGSLGSCGNPLCSFSAGDFPADSASNSGLFSLSSLSLPVLFRPRSFGTETCLLPRGGLLASNFSCAFWALLAVGRVILVRKLSLGAFAVLATRALGFS